MRISHPLTRLTATLAATVAVVAVTASAATAAPQVEATPLAAADVCSFAAAATQANPACITATSAAVTETINGVTRTKAETVALIATTEATVVTVAYSSTRAARAAQRRDLSRLRAISQGAATIAKPTRYGYVTATCRTVGVTPVRAHDLRLCAQMLADTQAARPVSVTD